MWHIEHLAIKANGTKARVLFEDVNDALGVGHLLFSWSERVVDYFRLICMDSNLAAETSTAVAEAIVLEAFCIVEINPYDANRLHLYGAGCC